MKNDFVDEKQISLREVEEGTQKVEIAEQPVEEAPAQEADIWHSPHSDAQTTDWTTQDVEYQKRFERDLERYREGSLPSITIGLWPYGNTNVDEVDREKKTHIEHIVGVFILAWFAVLFWHLFSTSFINLVFNVKGMFAFLVIPLFTLLRGCTHLRFNSLSMQFVSKTVATTRVRKRVEWSKLSRVYLDGKTKPTVLDQSICFEESSGKIHRIRLRKIANKAQWLKLLEALESWSGLNLDELDRHVFDSVSQDRSSPTYTMLWLEALSAPPRRERLAPLSEGATLYKGQYRLVRKLGAGGQGSAFLAESTTDASRVVLKEYILPIYVDIKARKQALERFENEAKMLTTLNHPSIVKLIDYFIDDHRAYLVLEYIEGDTLQQLVGKHGPLTNADASHYANELVDILSYLHSQSPPVVHRDFTPDNLIVSKEGKIKLIDFMVAQSSDAVQQQSTVSTVVGKHAYMAPEQFRGQNRPQSDLYAFGCTMYYLLTGVEPEPITQLHPLLKNDSCDPIFNDIVSKCTEATWTDRYASADEIRDQLRRLKV